MTYGMRSFHFKVGFDQTAPTSLTDGIAVVRRMLADGKTTKEVALVFGVKPSSVAQFARRNNLIRRSNKQIGKVFQERLAL